MRGAGSPMAPRLPPALLPTAWCRTEPWNAGEMHPIMDPTLESLVTEWSPPREQGSLIGKGDSGCLWAQKRSQSHEALINKAQPFV